MNVLNKFQTNSNFHLKKTNHHHQNIDISWKYISNYKNFIGSTYFSMGNYIHITIFKVAF